MSYGREYTAPKNVLPVFNPYEFIPPVLNSDTIFATNIETANTSQQNQLTDNNDIYDAFKVALATSVLTNVPPTQPTQTGNQQYNFLNTDGTPLTFTGVTGRSYVVALNGKATSTSAITYFQIIVQNGSVFTYYYEIPQLNGTSQTVLNFSKLIPLQGNGGTISFLYRMIVGSTYSLSSTTNYLKL